MTWEDLGKELELSRSMLHYIRSGERQLSGRSLHRLCDAERAAGIETDSLIEKKLVLSGLMLPQTPAEQEILQTIILEKVAAIELACSELRSILTRQIKVEITPLSAFDEPAPFTAEQQRLKEKLFKQPAKP